MKRELKWKSDEAAAAAAATPSSDVTDHQQNIVRSCISRLRRGSELKTTVTLSRFPRANITSFSFPRATRADTVSGKPSLVEQDEEEEQSLKQGVAKDAVAMTSLTGGALRDGECRDDTEVERRRQQVLAMLNTAEGQRMVQQMFIVRDQLKQELASLAQRLKRIEHHIDTMMQSGSS